MDRQATLLLCEYVTRHEDNTYTIVRGGVAKLHRPVVPAPLELHIFLRFLGARGDAGKVDLTLTISKAGSPGYLRIQSDGDLIFQSTSDFAWAMLPIPLNGVMLPEFGEYEIVATINGEPLAQAHFELARSKAVDGVQ